MTDKTDLALAANQSDVEALAATTAERPGTVTSEPEPSTSDPDWKQDQAETTRIKPGPSDTQDEYLAGIMKHAYLHDGDTPPASQAVEQFVVRKGGYFYRPNAQGYTSSIHEAGLWPKDEADKYAVGVEGVTVHPASEFAQQTCARCQGNGEIVTDWSRYTNPSPGDTGEEALAECPDCDGTGRVDALLFAQRASVEEVARTISESYGENPDDLMPRHTMCGPDNEQLPYWMRYEEQARAILAKFKMEGR